MDLGHGLREERVDTSSSDCSWTSCDLSTDLTSVSSDQVSTPGGPNTFEEQQKKSSSVKVSSEARHRQVAWRETSFLGSDE
ncbi:uncharacterized protein ACO6RY_00260 [Pungitius sinensis]